MAKKTTSTRSVPQSAVKNPQNNSGSSSSPLLTPLALLLLGMVQMARAQAERADEVLAEPSAADAQAAAAAAAGDLGVEGSAAPSAQAQGSMPVLDELLALLESLAESARQGALDLVQADAATVAAVAPEADLAVALPEGADRLGQLARAEAILEAYQSVIEQLPADLVLAQAPAAAAAAGEAAGAGAAAAAGASAGSLLAGLLGLVALGAAAGGGKSAAANVSPSGAVIISGTAAQGQVLTASNSLADSDGIPSTGSGAIAYQWRADGVAISGATGSSLTLAQAQVGKAISVVASYTDAKGTAESVTSTATAAVANVNDAPVGTVSVAGTATQGQVLTASNNLTDADGIPSTGAGAVAYQWKADGTAIAGATSASLTLAQAQVGKAITVTASYTDSLGAAESSTSTATSAVANVNDAPAGAVSITGTAELGKVLTASNSLTDADGIPATGSGAIAYQWKANGVAIAGATSSTLTLADAQVGKVITVTAAYTDSLGSAESVTSVATAAVTVDLFLHDGYVDGANIYLDSNDNGKVDLGTDKLLGKTVNGKLAVALTDADKLHATLAQGGTDISTGSTFEGVYSTTAGSTVINPLTTLVQALVQTTVDSLGTLSASDKAAAVVQAKSTAMATVSTALGIDSDVDLTTVDTVKASAGTGTAALGAADAIELHSKSLMVANMISVGSATLTGAVGSGTADLSKFVVQGIVSSISAASASGEVVSFKSSDAITQILNSAVSAAKTSNVVVNDAVMDASTSSVSGAVASANQLINAFAGEAAKAASASGASATAANSGLTQMLQAQKVVLNQVSGLKTADVATLTTLTGLGDTATLLTQSQAITTGLKIGETTATAVTRVADTSSATVLSVDVNPARVGDLAQVVVQMSESVLVAGNGRPSLAISTGTGTTATALFDKGLSVGDTLVFTYRVQAGDTLIAVANGASITLPTGVTVKDLAGNNATATIATGKSIPVDSVAPTVTITSDAAFVKAAATATITFTLSEAASTRTSGAFTADDVTVKNGTLTNFTKVSDTVYTAKLAATSATAPAEVGMAGGKFTDAAGNANQPSNVVLLAQEGAAPVVAVSAGQSFFNSVNSQGSPSTSLKFSLSADSTDFAASDVTVTGGGELIGFSGSGKNYTATLSGITSETQVKVGKDAFGVAGTTAKNGDSNTLAFKVDTSKPTVSIAVLKGTTGSEAVSADSTLKAGESARVTFTFSEEVKGFDLRAVKVAGGFLDNLAQDKTDPKKFTAMFKPADPLAGQTAVVAADISVDANRVTDVNGNSNTAASAKFKVDNIRPDVLQVTDNVASTLKAGATVVYTYALNKAVTGLEVADFVATNGTVQAVAPVANTLVSGSGATGTYTSWTVSVLPTANVAAGRIGLSLKAGGVLDAAGNANEAHAQNLQAIDTLAPTATVALDKAIFLKASANNNVPMTSTISVNFSEAVASLEASAFTVSGAGGTVSNLAKVGDGKQWTATFTPTEAASAGNVKVSLAGSYQDAAGNSGAAAESAVLRTNVVAPVLSITAAKTALKTTDTSTTLNFSFSEAVTGFERSDVTVTGGTLGALTKSSDTLWTAVFTPTVDTKPTSASIAVANQTFVSTAANIDGFGGKVDLRANLTNPGLSSLPSVSATTVAGTAGNSAGEAMVLTLNFDTNVRGLTSGSNSTIFTLGGTGQSAVWGGTDGSNTRTLTYTVAAGQNGQAAIDEAALKTALEASISDADGLAFVQSANIANIDATPLPLVDTTVATLGSPVPGTTTTAVAGTSGNSAGETIVLTVNFDGNVSGLNSGTNNTVFTVGGTGVSAVWGGVAGSSTRTLTYTVAAGQNGQAAIDEAALKAALTAGITDVAGNAFSYTANSGTIANIDATALPVIDTTAPTTTSAVTAVVDNVGTIVGNLASGAVTDDASVSVTGTLGGATAGASLPIGETLKVFDGATLLGTATVVVVAGGQSTWSYTDTRTLTNAQSLSYTARVADEAGNESAAGTAFVMTVDTVAPGVTSMVSTPSLYLKPSANGGQSQTGEIKVAFSEAITGLGVDDFELKYGGVVQSSDVRAAALSNVAGSGKDWTVKFTPPVAGATGGSSTAVDTGAGFVEIKNQALKQQNGKTTVTFDVTLDAGSYEGKNITGSTIDLKYQYSAVSAGQVVSVQFDDPIFSGKIDAWENITHNLGSTGNGKIVMTAKGLSSQDPTVINANPRIDSAAGGKAFGVTLVINQLLDSFEVGFDSPTGSPAGATSLTLADSTTVAPALGIAKTAYIAGGAPATGTDVSAVSLTLTGGYTDLAGNAGSSSATPLNLLVNQVNPLLTLTFDTVTAAGDLVFKVEASDSAVTGLAANDFTAVNGTVVAGSFAPVSGQAGKYTVSVTPTATGDVKLNAAADAGLSGSLGTQAAESAATRVLKGTSGDDAINLADGRVILLGAGNDTVKVNAPADSSVASLATVVGVAAGDKLDISALLNKASTQAQYFTMVDNTFTGSLPAGWLKGLNQSTATDLGTVGDNELRYREVVQDNTMTLTFAYDADSRAGSTSLSEPVQIRLVTADAAALAAFRQGTSSAGNVVVEKIAPTISVAMDGGKTSFAKTNPGTGTVVFTTSEPIAALPSSSVAVTGGTISAPTQTGALTWTSTFTPSTDASLTAGSISVKNASYADFQGNTGSASTELALKLNVMAPTLKMGWKDVTTDGTLTFNVESDQALTGLEKSDFSIPNQTILTFQKTSSGTALPEVYQGTVKPTASGAVTLTLPAGVAAGTQLATPAVVSDPATIDFVKSASDGQPIVVTGPSGMTTPKMIVLGAIDEVIKVTGVGSATAAGATNFMGILVGVNSGDKVDMSQVLGGLGYKSLAVVDAPDVGDGFVEIKNQVLTQASGKTTVSFDVAFDAATYNSQKITGAVLDLKYQYSAVAAGLVTPVQFEDPIFGGKLNVWENITDNLGSTGNGKIAMTLKGVQDQTLLNANPVIDSTQNGKAIGVKLVINSLVSSFNVGFDLASDNPAGMNNLTLVNGTNVAPTLGISKTARLAGVTAGPAADALELVVTKQTIAANADTPAFGTAPTDNQFKVLQVIKSNSVSGQAAKIGTLLFQYDTNPAVGTTTLSPVLEATMVSNDISAYFDTSYVKLI